MCSKWIKSGWEGLKNPKNPVLALAAIVAAIAAVVGSLAAVYSLAETKNVLERTQRAWLAPGGIKIRVPFAMDQSREIWLRYGNTGKEPARQINATFAVIAFPAKNKIRNSDAVNMAILKKMGGVRCIDRRPDKEGGVAFPSKPDAYSYRVHAEKNIVNQIIGMDSYLVVAGCFAYKSFDKVRHSAFCRFFDFNVDGRENSLKWLSSRCFVREYAS